MLYQAIWLITTAGCLTAHKKATIKDYLTVAFKGFKVADRVILYSRSAHAFVRLKLLTLLRWR
jgi:hypothetical protein